MSEVEIKKLMSRAKRLGENAAGIEAAERAVRSADTFGELELQRISRNILIRLGTYGGAPEKALVAFSWSLASLDREPSEGWTETLLWRYKWILSSLWEWPEFTLEQIAQADQDAVRRYAEEGYSARPLLMLRSDERLYRGLLVEATELMDRALSLPRDGQSDCQACEPTFTADLANAHGDWQGALDASAPVLEDGQTCSGQPESTHARILEALCELGRVEEAVEYHRQSFARTLDDSNATGLVSLHIKFLARTENHGRAVEAFSTFWKKTLSESPHVKFQFALAVSLLLKDLGEDPRGVAFDVRIPREHPLHGVTSGKDLAELASHFDDQCRQLAAKFDARNGTQRYANEIREAAERVSRRIPFVI